MVHELETVAKVNRTVRSYFEDQITSGNFSSFPFLGFGVFGRQINMAISAGAEEGEKLVEDNIKCAIKGAVGLFCLNTGVKPVEFEYIVIGKTTYRKGHDTGYKFRDQFWDGNSNVKETVACEILFPSGTYSVLNDYRLTVSDGFEMSESELSEEWSFGLEFEEVVKPLNILDMETLTNDLFMETETVLDIIYHQHNGDEHSLDDLAFEALEYAEREYPGKYDSQIAEIRKEMGKKYSDFEQIFNKKLTD